MCVCVCAGAYPGGGAQGMEESERCPLLLEAIPIKNAKYSLFFYG